MLKLSGARLCWVVLFTVLATATRAIPRVLTEAKGISDSATAVFVLRPASTRPGSRQLSCNTTAIICPYSHHRERFPRFSGMLQQQTGKKRLHFLETQRE